MCAQVQDVMEALVVVWLENKPTCAGGGRSDELSRERATPMRGGAFLRECAGPRCFSGVVNQTTGDCKCIVYS